MDPFSLSEQLTEHSACMAALRQIETRVLDAGRMLCAAVEAGRKILICGNGGSAADAQHFAAELVGRFETERASFPSIALTTNTSNLTAVGNDYGFDRVFSRQVEGLGKPEDVLIGVSTSGNSPNILEAVRKAAGMGIHTIGLLGRSGGVIASEVDCAVTVPWQRTARIQEAHIFILHFWAFCIDGCRLGDVS